MTTAANVQVSLPDTGSIDDEQFPVDKITWQRYELREHYKNIDLTASVTMQITIPKAQGGFACIYQGQRHEGDDTRILAFKYINETVTSREKSRVLKRLREEISVWRRLGDTHPNIQPFIGLYWEQGSILPKLVSVWQENGNLITYLDKLPSSTQEDITALRQTKLNLLREVLNGVRFLHAERVIHADIKGANVLISPTGTALLSDFGASWTDVKHSVSFTASAGARGTIGHMAPELFEFPDEPYEPNEPYEADEPARSASTTRRFTEKSDIWAFGCLILEVISGKSAWDGYPGVRIMSELLRGRVFRRPADVDDPTWKVVADCCKREPSERCTTEVLQAELDNLASY